MQPTIGCIVHYTLGAEDVAAAVAKLRRSPAGHVIGANEPRAGDACAAVIVRVWGTGTPSESCNLQVLLDSDTQLWVTSRYEGEGLGTWAWPPTA